MSAWGEHLVPAFALGAALGAAPGPVQLLILNETARHGIGQGFRVMLGANGMLFVVLATLALGFSTMEPSPEIVRGLRIVGGLFLVYLALNELRTLRRESVGVPVVDRTGARLGPTARGVLLVIVNPGAWIFFATTAAAVMAEASADGGRDVALLTAVAMTLGVSLTDFGSALVGTGSRAMLGERALAWVRIGLSVLLLGIGVAFVVQGVRG
ncbi:MAG TPA: LysE family transporter [Actinomycetota bacterium]